MTIMRKLFILIAFFTLAATSTSAQEVTDTIYNPNILFTGVPRTYEIAGIEITGADGYSDQNILNYSGLNVGDRLEIPGDEWNAIAKRFWRQQLFSKIQIKITKIYGDKAWVEFALRPQPRISEIHYYGVKKGERDDLQERLQLMKGNQITQNIINRATDIIKGYFSGKGFGNADVKIEQREDLSHENEVIVDINVDKHEKVKVHKIYIDGNEVMSDGKIKSTMKKTNEKGIQNLRKIFSQKRFVNNDYKDDLNRIIQK